MLEITHLPLLMGPGAGTTATARTTFSLTVVDLRTERFSCRGQSWK